MVVASHAPFDPGQGLRKSLVVRGGILCCEEEVEIQAHPGHATLGHNRCDTETARFLDASAEKCEGSGGPGLESSAHPVYPFIRTRPYACAMCWNSSWPAIVAAGNCAASEKWASMERAPVRRRASIWIASSSESPDRVSSSGVSMRPYHRRAPNHFPRRYVASSWRSLPRKSCISEEMPWSPLATTMGCGPTDGGSPA